MSREEYKYEMRVVETAEYSVVITSPEPLSFRELKETADARRHAGMGVRTGSPRHDYYLAAVEHKKEEQQDEQGNG
jgi:hypothetical protein